MIYSQLILKINLIELWLVQELTQLKLSVHSKMEKKPKEEGRPHCLVLSFPLQGHINPMFQFSKRLKHAGIPRITLVTTKSFLKSVQNFSHPVEAISDGFDDGVPESVSPEVFIGRCSEYGSRTLAELVEKLRSSGSPADCVIYDPFYPWVLDVAQKFGLMTAVFFTQPNSVNCIYFNAYTGELKLPVLMEDGIRIIPGGFPVLDRSDLPSFIQDHESDPKRSEIMSEQFRNVERVDWVFVNTFHHLEQEVTDWMLKYMAMRTIGPTMPSMFLDKRIPHNRQYGLSIFTPITDPCFEWLDQQPVRSVVYVSFGSFAKPTVEQMHELALALKSVDRPFLWVVRASEESKLPTDYKEETRDTGLVVAWCPQLQVLEHEAVGCFVTHCGWNSTLEALSLGVPMVAMPQWSDQHTNAKFVEDVWRTGMRAKRDEKGLVGREEIVRCVKLVMEGEKEEEIMRSNSIKWKELARKAVDEGGSSDQNIQEFVSSLMRLKF
ncbi:UDP-glycosyltransferase 74G1-like [Henckelia pumila]|uniref:UDP-glycosyltransferase 74G1-like n=1 Tax=Henckelia pumila TaxID=405737 RepID=UPI003C6E6E6C